MDAGTKPLSVLRALVSRQPVPVLLICVLLTSAVFSTRPDRYFYRPKPCSGSEWRPRPDKFILAWCMQGQLSNQLRCLKSTLEAAQILHRSLIIPTYGVYDVPGEKKPAFRWDTIIDLQYTQACMGTCSHMWTGLVTLDEYLARTNKTEARVGRFVCLSWVMNRCYQGRYRNDVEFLRLHQGSIQIPRMEGVRRRTLQGRHSVDAGYVVQKLGGIEDEILVVGEMFGVKWTQPPEELEAFMPRKCRDLWRPPAVVTNLVQGFQKHRLGSGYAALHFRRGDFYAYLSGNGQRTGIALSRVYPPPHAVGQQVGQFLAQKSLSKLYLATNARPMEIDMLKAALQSSNVTGQVKLHMIQDVLEDVKALAVKHEWARQGVELLSWLPQRPVVLAMLDKHMCVRAQHFLPSVCSTFSMGIIEERIVQGLNQRGETADLWRKSCTPPPVGKATK